MILKMSLKINNWRTIVKWVIYTLLLILLLIFVVRVLVFEHNYYNEKEGSERVTMSLADPAEDLIEQPPTTTEVAEYTVAADKPRYLTVEKLGVDKARILPMGVNSKGELMTPINIFDVGWYNASGLPGGGGTIILDGHNGGPHVHGVFKRLPDLVAGDIITLERGDGAIFKYAVVENKTIPLDTADAYMAVAARSPESGKEAITLISCTGEWSQAQQTYLSRQFTRAVLVNE